MDAEVKTRATFADYAAMPETNQIVELIDGEIVRETVIYISPFAHQEVLESVHVFLVSLMSVGKLCLTPTILHTDDENSFEPDIFWVSPDNEMCFLEDNGRYWRGAPDLVVEILSPTTASNDRGVKFDIYEKVGVREYWLVDPEARFVEVYRSAENKFERQGVFKPGQVFLSPVLSGATINNQSWFAAEG